MQSHSMTEGAENLNLNGKHLDTEVFSEKTIRSNSPFWGYFCGKGHEKSKRCENNFNI